MRTIASVMNRIRHEWLQLLLLLAPFCVAALLWDRLPERMPVHWNARGEVDGYAGRTFAVLFVPLVNIGIALLAAVVALIDPKVRSADPEGRENFRRVLKGIRLAITGCMAVVAVAVVLIGAGYPIEMARVLGVTFAVLFGIVGNFMGKLRPNYFTGIRTPWTLESREVWIKTHRLAGRLLVGAALPLVAACVVLPSNWSVWLAVGVPMVILLFSACYSFFVYKKQQPA
jgi:uncharacterized membrane protein